MASPTTTPTGPGLTAPPAVLDGLPLLYEDEDEGDMGETNVHEITSSILRFGLEGHLSGGRQPPEFQVFSNLNLYYHPTDLRAYVSPDLMVVRPFTRLPLDISSYRIGVQGPGPVLAAEILSERSAQQRDQTDKVVLYAKLHAAEYVLVDVTGRYLPPRLLMKRLLPNGTWHDEQDPDGGVSSQLGFRLILDSDAKLQVINKGTGKAYVRPDEAEGRLRELEKAYQTELEARRTAEEELQRLRRMLEEKERP